MANVYLTRAHVLSMCFWFMSIVQCQSSSSTTSSSSPIKQPITIASTSSHGTVVTKLNSEFLAQVGHQLISTKFVVDVAQKQHLTLRQALEISIEEMLLANAARERKADQSPQVHREIQKEQARLLLEQWTIKAQNLGPYREEEIQKVMQDDWVDFDRPESRRVVHVLVRNGTSSGLQWAERLHKKLLAIFDSEQFLSVARQFATEQNLSIVAEAIDDAFTIEGVPVVRRATYKLDSSFAQAAFQLTHVGDVSPIVFTPFGWHILKLIEIRPAYRLSMASKVDQLRPKILSARIRAPFKNYLESLQINAKLQHLYTEQELALPFSDNSPKVVVH